MAKTSSIRVSSEPFPGHISKLPFSPHTPPSLPEPQGSQPSGMFPADWSEFRPVSLGCIPVSVRQIIDRAQVSVRNGDGGYQALVEILKERLVYRGVVCPRKRNVVFAILRFKLGNCRLNVVLWNKKYFFSIIVMRPTEEVFRNLHDALLSLPKPKKGEAWYLSQLEIALDVLPQNTADVDLVQYHLVQGVTIPRARGASHRRFRGTDYFTSSDKRISKVGKGIRSYVKQECGLAFARLEVQFNAAALTALGLRQSLLIDPTGINVFEHFRYRYCEVNTLEQAIRHTAASRMATAIRLNLALNPRGLSQEARFGDKASVAQQLEHFRKLNPRYAKLVEKKLGKYFPVSCKAKALPRDLANGYVRERYRTRPPTGKFR